MQPARFINMFRSMNQIDPSGSDLDSNIDLESGGTTSEEDASKILGLDSENSKKLLGGVRSGLISCKSLSECENGENCLCSFGKFIITDEISAKSVEQLQKCGQKVIKFGHKTIDEERPKKQKSTKPSKPPRPPRGPSLDASDLKLLKEITELSLKRRRKRSRIFKRIRTEKASSSNANLFACFVTVVFLLVIIFQGLLGSRM